MTGEREFQPGDILRIALPGSDEDLQFVISDVRDDGGAETVSLDPRPRQRGPTAALGGAAVPARGMSRPESRATSFLEQAPEAGVLRHHPGHA
jgi:hypothetical protein